MENRYLILDNLRKIVRGCEYDPVSGRGCCGARVEEPTPLPELPVACVPRAMTLDPAYKASLDSPAQWQRLRCRYDFEYWCATCGYIKQKGGAKPAPCRPNGGQRAVIAVLEADRNAGRPMRLIVLKARQWGCSTLIQLYMAWMQICVRLNWNSLICAHVRDTSAVIRGMFSRLLALYPADLWEGDAPPKLLPYERAENIRAIAGRDCTVTIASGERQDAVRGADIAMAHLCEVAFWRDSEQHSPAAAVQAVYGTVALLPDTLVVLESTANGVGNYFHSEWLRCKAGAGDKHAVFVPWYEIEMYCSEPADPADFAASLDAAGKQLWNMGLTLGQINWYVHKMRESGDPERVRAEFPTTDDEAFCNTGNNVFDRRHVEALRAECVGASAERGAISPEGRRFVADGTGALLVWRHPVREGRYVVAVDVGGRSRGSDWSVIAVLKRGNGDALPEVVAQWRGHCDHDRLAAEAALVGRYYNDALLVIESNTFETAEYGGVADSNMFILSRLAEQYPNLYFRRSYDRSGAGTTRYYGFHTNRATKSMLIGNLIAAVRDGLYIERDPEACNEFSTYEQRPNGSFGARAGYHDDILMTRAIALHIIATEPDAAVDFAAYSQPSW